MKPWQVFGLSLLAALGLHAVILLVPRVAARGDRGLPTIEVSLATQADEQGAGEAPPGAPSARSPVPPAPRAADGETPSPAREPPPAAPDPPAAPQQERPAATEEAGAVSVGVAGPASGVAVSAGPAGPASAAPASGSGTGGADAGGEPSGQAGGAPGAGGQAAAGSTISVPRPRGEILPAYPRAARRAGWEGVVTIRAFIDQAGKVVSAEILSSSGHSSLDQAALEAVKRAAFDPALRGALPVSSPVNIPVRFQLN